MFSAFVAATFYHLFTSTDLSDGVVEAPKKAHVLVTFFFIAYHFYSAYYTLPAAKPYAPKASTNKKKK